MFRQFGLLMLCGAVAITSSAVSAEDAKAVAMKIGDIELKVPSNWKKEAPSNNLRLAQFVIPAAEGDDDTGELVISSFGGTGGGVKANVERWIGQFENEGRKAKVTHGVSPQGKYVMVDISGIYKKPIGPPIRRQTKSVAGSRMMAVILQVEGKGFYFLKLTGLEKTVEAAAKPLRTSFSGDASKEEPLDF